MNPSTTTTPQMDNDVINLAKAIRQTESGGNFDAKGASGESGAYQWMPDTWKAHAKQALGDENAPMTPDNQNAVAYTVLKSWKDQGLNPAQIAAKWNSGSEIGWENKVGTNSMGVAYNVPKYVKSVTDAYQKVKAGGTPLADPNNPSSTAAPQPTPAQPEESFGSKVGGFLKTIASPVATMVARPFQAVAGLAGADLNDIDKFTEENLSKIGLGGLVAPTPKNFSDLPKDIGRGIETAAFGMSPVKGGAAFGLGASMEQGNPVLSGETVLSTAGGALGGKAVDLVGKAVAPVLMKSGLVPSGIAEKSYNTAKNKIVKAYEDTLPLTPTQKIKEGNLLKKTGDNLYTTLADHGITVGTPDVIPQLQQISERYAQGIAQAQKYESKYFDLGELQKQIQKGINDRIVSQTARNAAKDKIESEIAAILKENPNAIQDGKVSSEIMERLRQVGNSWTPFNASDPEKVGMSTGYALANAVRDMVEKYGTFPAYREANREWSKILHAQEMMSKLENSGKDFRKLGGLSGQMAQKTLSGIFGYHTAGIGGALLSEMGTEMASKVISNPKYRTYLSRQIVKNFHGRTPDKSALAKLAKEVEQYVQEKESRLALPPQSTIFAKAAKEKGVTAAEREANNFKQNLRMQNTRLALPEPRPDMVQGVVKTIPPAKAIEKPAKVIRMYDESRDAKLKALKKKKEENL